MVKTKYPGVVQLVARDIWDVEAGSSSLPTRTKKPSGVADPEGLCISYIVAIVIMFLQNYPLLLGTKVFQQPLALYF